MSVMERSLIREGGDVILHHLEFPHALSAYHASHLDIGRRALCRHRGTMDGALSKGLIAMEGTLNGIAEAEEYCLRGIIRGAHPDAHLQIMCAAHQCPGT